MRKRDKLLVQQMDVASGDRDLIVIRSVTVVPETARQGMKSLEGEANLVAVAGVSVLNSLDAAAHLSTWARAKKISFI